MTLFCTLGVIYMVNGAHLMRGFSSLFNKLRQRWGWQGDRVTCLVGTPTSGCSCQWVAEDRKMRSSWWWSSSKQLPIPFTENILQKQAERNFLQNPKPYVRASAVLVVVSTAWAWKHIEFHWIRLFFREAWALRLLCEAFAHGLWVHAAGLVRCFISKTSDRKLWM